MGTNPFYFRFVNLSYIKGNPVIVGGEITTLLSCQVNGKSVAIEGIEGQEADSRGFQNLYVKTDFDKGIGAELWGQLVDLLTKAKADYGVRTVEAGETKDGREYEAFDVFEARPKAGKVIAAKLGIRTRNLGEKQGYKLVEEIVSISFVTAKDMPKAKAKSSQLKGVKLGSYQEQGDEPSPASTRDIGPGRVSGAPRPPRA